VVRDGELVFYSMGYYPEPCLAVVERQASMTYCRFDPVADKDVFEEAGPLASRAVAALGLTDGVFHMELFRPRDGGPLMFGECAARRGAAMIFEEVLWKFNVDLAEETLRAVLGWPPRLDVSVRPGAIGTTNVNAPAGVLLSIPAVADIRRQPGVVYARVEMPVGATIAGQIPDAASRLSEVLVTAEDPGQLQQRFADVRAWFLDQLIVVPPNATDRALRAWQQRNWPSSQVGDEELFEPDDFVTEESS
jgi:biotin carboxylase